MDRTTSGNRPTGRQRTGNPPEDLLIDASDTADDDNSAPVGNASGAPPQLHTQEPRKSFFSRIFSDRPEDVQVKEEAKKIAPYLPQLIKLEQDLVAIIKKLDELIKLLRAATTDGNQTALETAARKVESDITILDAEIGKLIPGLTPVEARNIKRRCVTLFADLKKSGIAYIDLYKETSNRSVDIDQRCMDLKTKYNRLLVAVDTLKSLNVDGDESNVLIGGDDSDADESSGDSL